MDTISSSKFFIPAPISEKYRIQLYAKKHNMSPIFE